MLGLGVKGVVDVHVGKDLVAGLDQIVAGLVGLDLAQAEVGLGVDQAGIDGHSLGVDNLRARGNLHRIGSAHGGDLAAGENDACRSR